MSPTRNRDFFQAPPLRTPQAILIFVRMYLSGGPIRPGKA